MTLENKHRGTVKQYTKRHRQRGAARDRTQGTADHGHPYTTEDRTEPYLAKQVKDHVKNYKRSRHWMYRSKRYATEVVITAEKLLLDNKETGSRR